MWIEMNVIVEIFISISQPLTSIISKIIFNFNTCCYFNLCLSSTPYSLPPSLSLHLLLLLLSTFLFPLSFSSYCRHPLFPSPSPPTVNILFSPLLLLLLSTFPSPSPPTVNILFSPLPLLLLSTFSFHFSL